MPHLIDPFDRAITYLRVSVTDRCDFRCAYCMSEDMTFLPKAEILSLEELDRLCSAFVRLGVRKLRMTGGEPLVRRDIMRGGGAAYIRGQENRRRRQRHRERGVMPHLIDPFDRAITYLRVSVTDRCDFRCAYCMSEDMTFLPKAEILSLEELDRLCSAFAPNFAGCLSRSTGQAPTSTSAVLLACSFSTDGRTLSRRPGARR